MSKLNASDKLCFVNFIFKNGCTDSVAVAETSENLWKEFLHKFCRDGKALKNNILTFNGIDGNACVDMSTVAKIEISNQDKGQIMIKGPRNYEVQCRINRNGININLLRCSRICRVCTMSDLKYQKGEWYHVQEDGTLKPVDYDKEVKEYYKNWRT